MMILGTIRIKIRRMKSSALYIHLRISLSIRRFWGKRGKMEARKGYIKNLLSPIPLGRPDTQAIYGLTCVNLGNYIANYI